MTVAAGTMRRTLVVFVLLATATAVAQDNKNPVTSVVKRKRCQPTSSGSGPRQSR